MTAPLSYSLSGAAAASGMSKSYIEKAIRTGRLRAKRSSTDDEGKPVGNYVILHSSLEAFLAELADA